MVPTNRRSRRALAEMVLFTLVMLLSLFLGMLLFSAFEPTLVRGVMRGLRIFLGVVVFVQGAAVFALAVQRFVREPHSMLRFAALFLLIGPLEYFGIKLALDALAV